MAHADGAFPNSQSVLLPRDRANEIILGTTFGLIFSEDTGATWQYACENELTRMSTGGQYQLGPPPDDRIYAIADVGSPVSADGACNWILAGGDVTTVKPQDVFPDPANPMRTFVLAMDTAIGTVAAYRSTDAGLNYEGPIFPSPPDSLVVGIESALTAPQTVYITYYDVVGTHPHLAMSMDGGDSWATSDIERDLGAVIPYLAAVDPTNPRRLYLRVASGGGISSSFQGIAISDDAGASWRMPLMVPGGTLSGFVRLPSGNLVAVGTTAPLMPGGSAVPALFRSDDAGQSFSTQSLPFHAAGLAQRNGQIFAATNNFLDGFALARSDDNGRNWTTLLRFRDIKGIKDCVRTSCQDDCDYQAGITLFPPNVCNPIDAAADGEPSDAATPPAKSGGCGCQLGTTGGPAGWQAAVGLVPVWVLACAAWLAGRRRRHSGSRRRHSGNA